MKKLLFALSIILLVAAGCNSSSTSQPTSQKPLPTPQTTKTTPLPTTSTNENTSTTNPRLVNCGYIPADKFDPRKFQNPDYRKAIICMSQAWQNCSPAEYSETNSDAVANNFKIVGKRADNCMIKLKTTQTNESYACTISPELTAELYRGTQVEKDIAFMSVQTSIVLFISGIPDKYTTCVKEVY
jgi:hypothetical protein